MNYKNLMQYLYNRFKEPSTWRGVVALLTAAGVTFSPDQAALIVSAGIGLIGAIGAFFPDVMKKKEVKKDNAKA